MLYSKRGVMALAVMAHLFERPMHAYEIAMTMRERGLDHTIKLNFGTLYHTVDFLLRAGQIAAQETEREGRRPERTVYALTPSGREHYLGWLRTLISRPAKEYSRFEAGLAFIWQLPADEATALLRERIAALESEVDFGDYLIGSLEEKGVPPLAIVELDHERMQRHAELEWTKRVVADIESGQMPWTAKREPRMRRPQGAAVTGED